jgi:hypothetical protein
METVKDLKAFFISLVVISVLCVFIAHRFGTLAEAAAPVPSKAVLQHVENIKKNQKAIAQLKDWNRAELTPMNKEGWTIEWDTLAVVPLVSAR